MVLERGLQPPSVRLAISGWIAVVQRGVDASPPAANHAGMPTFGSDPQHVPRLMEEEDQGRLRHLTGRGAAPEVERAGADGWCQRASSLGGGASSWAESCAARRAIAGAGVHIHGTCTWYLVATWLPGRLRCWLPSCLATRIPQHSVVAGWLAGWLAGWRAGWLAGWLGAVDGRFAARECCCVGSLLPRATYTKHLHAIASDVHFLPQSIDGISRPVLVAWMETAAVVEILASSLQSSRSETGLITLIHSHQQHRFIVPHEPMEWCLVRDPACFQLSCVLLRPAHPATALCFPM